MNQEAQLTVLLTLKDQLTSGVHSASAALSGLSSQSTMSGRALSTLGSAASTTMGHIRTLVGGLGLMGLGGGLIAITGLLKSSISDTQTFGEAVAQLHKLTGESAETLSSLASAMVASGTSSETAQKSIGMMNKLIGGMSTDKQAAYELQYGISLKNTSVTARQLTDAINVLGSAKASTAAKTAAATTINKYNAASYKSTNELVLQAADYYNNELVPAEDKAAALAKTFGRSWQTLIPLFEQGSQGILEVEQQAASMGMVITTENLPAIEKMHDASIRWNQAMGGLQLQIGLALLPALSDLADSASAFVTGHKGDIVSFFKGAADFAGQLGGVITNDVVPALGTIIGWWNSIPGPLQQLLIGGFLVNRITGVGPMDLAKIFTGGGGVAGGGVTGGILGGVQHVWVDNMGVGVGGGGGGGGAGPAAVAGGGVGLLGTGLAIGAAAIAIYAAIQTYQSTFGPQGEVSAKQKTTDQQIAQWGQTLTSQDENIKALQAEVQVYRGNTGNLISSLLLNTAGGSQMGEALKTAADKLAAGVNITPEGIAAIKDALATAQDMYGNVQTEQNRQLVESLKIDLAKAQKLPYGNTDVVAQTAADAIGRRWAGGAGVKAEAAKEAAAASQAIATRWAGPLTLIAQEQAQLKSLQAQQLAQQKTGDVRLGSTLSSRIAALQQTIREQQTNVSVVVNTTISAGDVAREDTRYHRYKTVVAE